jgi:hypothetical protein
MREPTASELQGEQDYVSQRGDAMRLHCAIARCFITLVVLAASLPLRAPLSAQTIGGYERGRGRDMLRVVRDRLEKHYYDSTFHGLDLRAAAARADSCPGLRPGASCREDEAER